MSLCTLYESKDNPLFQKMIENVIKNEPRVLEKLVSTTPVFAQKFEETSRQLEKLVLENVVTQEWDVRPFEDILGFKMDTIYSVYKLLKVYPNAAELLFQYPNFVSRLESCITFRLFNLLFWISL